MDIKHDLADVAAQYSVAITPQVEDLLHHQGINRQFVPTVEELQDTYDELHDPIGDQVYSAVKGLIHRYPDRCLLQPVKVCPVYCRFCFRRETVGKSNAGLTKQELENCYEYITKNPDIWEVILSGGDPLILSPKKMHEIIQRLDQIKHVKIIRIHSRVPVLDSKRINTEMLMALTQRRPIYIALHINHPEEFTPQAMNTIAKLADSGVVLLGQTVLLKGVNDNPDTLGKVMRLMVENRIKPYYLHHPDLARGTSHFRCTIAQGQKIMAQLRGRYSGLCQPSYVLDIPGGAGKSPIGPSYLDKMGCEYIVTNYQGKQFTYPDKY